MTTSQTRRNREFGSNIDHGMSCFICSISCEAPSIFARLECEVLWFVKLSLSSPNTMLDCSFAMNRSAWNDSASGDAAGPISLGSAKDASDIKLSRSRAG